MQFISCITLTHVAAWGVGTVMITASIVNSTLVNVCNLVEERLKNGAVFIVLLYNTNAAHNISAPDTLVLATSLTITSD